MKQVIFFTILGVLFLAQFTTAQIPTDSLVAYYPFNGNASDSSPNGLNGTTNSGISWTYDRFGNSNAAANFDGISGVIDIADNSLIDLTSNFSIGLWAKPATAQNCIIVSKHRRSTSNDGTWFIQVDSKKFEFTNWPGSGLVLYGKDTTTEVSDNWCFVCFTFDKSTNSWRFYINGKVDSMGINTFVIQNTTYPLRFGNEQNQNGSYYSGALDDIRIYKRALSESEIQALYHEDGYDPSLVAYYPFNGNANDESGKGNDGTPSGNVIWVTNRFGQASSAANFDGDVSTFISAPTTMFPTGNAARSISLWVKAVDFSQAANIAGWGQNSSNNLCFISCSNVPPEAFSRKIFLWGYDDDLHTKSSFGDNQWYHIVYTHDGFTSSFFINGSLDTSLAMNFSTSTGSTFYVGYRPSTTEHGPFNGVVDDIRIYSRPLSGTEIKALYHENGWGTIHVNMDQFVTHVGDTVMVSVNASFPQEKTYSSAELSFGGFQQNGLSFLGIDTTSSMMNNKDWQIQLNNTDTLLITASAGAQDVSGSGVLFNLKFAVTGSPCTFVPITITKAVFNTGADSVVITSGGVNIKAIPVYGDVDGNGQVQAYDASLVLKGLVGIDTLGCQALANAIVNCDTALSAYDATLILQNVVGLVTLPHCVSALASGTLTAENVASAGGGFVDVPLVLSNGSNIFSFEGEISYDISRLEFKSITWAPTLNSFSPIYKDNVGIVKFAGANSQEDGHTGIFATLHFKFKYQGATDTVKVRNLRWNGKPANTYLRIPMDVPSTGKALPKEFRLEQNYPNPFNPATSIRFALPKSSYVTLKVFNLLGQEVGALVNGELQAGYHDVTWDASKMPSGMYFYRIQAGRFVETKKLLLMK
ncbi:MAG: LamG-like jellyroll fold domain-containing protein [Bacteroidota bacterium]|jgi:hypothetical protein